MKHIELFESYFSESENSSDFEMRIKGLGMSPKHEDIVEVFETFLENASNIEEVKMMYDFLVNNYDFGLTEDVLQSKTTPESQAKIHAARLVRDFGKKLGLI
jgi:hypothetical protein